MANQKHLKMLQQGVNVWNAWREAHSNVQPDLRGASLRKSKLSEEKRYGRDTSEGRSFGGINLDDADLTGADLTEVTSEARMVIMLISLTQILAMPT
jgi:uncharacterized protein YjbI with pentapeptide repeats